VGPDGGRGAAKVPRPAKKRTSGSPCGPVWGGPWGWCPPWAGGTRPLGSAPLRGGGWPMAGRASGTALFQHPSTLQGFQVAKLAGEGKFRISKSGGIGSFLAICFMKKAMPEAAH
jgi:hypothetical protein